MYGWNWPRFSSQKESSKVNMPYGIPKTDNERKETHKFIYGNTNVPKKRKGKNRKLREYYQIRNKKY